MSWANLTARFDRTFVVGDAGEDAGVHRLAFEEHAAELLLLRLGGAFQQVKDGQRELATGEVSAQRLADGFFIVATMSRQSS
jgi:hypothetical protein